MQRTQILVLIIGVCLLSGCQINAYQSSLPDPSISYVAQTLEREEVENMTLTIYYLPWHIFLRAPLTVDNLINDKHTEVVVLSKDEIAETVQKLKEEFPSTTLEPAKNPKGRQFARLYYVFEVNGEKLFDISLGGSNDNMFFNGTEMEFNDLFYRVVESYIPNYNYNPNETGGDQCEEKNG